MDIMINCREEFVMVGAIEIGGVLGMCWGRGMGCGRVGGLWGWFGVMLRVFFAGLSLFVLGCLGSSFFVIIMLLLLGAMLVSIMDYISLYSVGKF